MCRDVQWHPAPADSLAQRGADDVVRLADRRRSQSVVDELLVPAVTQLDIGTVSPGSVQECVGSRLLRPLERRSTGTLSS